jgi:hypothetical protein
MSRTTEHLDHHVWFGTTECLPLRIVAEQYPDDAEFPTCVHPRR